MSNENIDEGVANEAKKHTAGHILFQSLKRVFPEMRIIKDIFKHEKTALIVTYPKELDWDKMLEAERIVNKIIEENRKVNLIDVPKEKVAERFGDKVRGRWDLIKDNTIRVVEVDDFDYSACMGKHVQSTSEIGMIIITKVHSLRKDEYEIQFEVGEEAKSRALEMGKIAAQVSNIMGTEFSRLPELIEKMKSRNELLEKNLREMNRQSLKAAENEYEEVKGVKFYSKIFEGFNKNEVGRCLVELVENEKIIAVFANINGEKAMILAGRSEDIDIDLLPLVREACKKLGGDAGSKNRLAMGGCNSEGLKKVFEELINDIKSKV